jgi:tetratricopeptide (TPR) repeat protein
MRLRPVIGWAVFIGLSSIIAQALPSPVGTYYFFQGQYFSKKGNYESAAEAYKKSVDSDPGFDRGYIELGSAYVQLEKYPEAEKQFQQAMKIKEDSCSACGLGAVYRLEKRNDEAEAMLQRAIKLSPSDSCGYSQLGRLYYDLEKYPLAADTFTNLVKLAPTSVNYHFLALSLFESGRVKDSIEPYRQALKLDQSNAALCIDLATSYSRLARYPEAEAALQLAVYAEPDSIKARSFLGVTQYLRGKTSEAMEQYHWVLGKDPKIAAEMLRGYKEIAETKNQMENKRQSLQNEQNKPSKAAAKDSR